MIARNAGTLEHALNGPQIVLNCVEIDRGHRGPNHRSDPSSSRGAPLGEVLEARVLLEKRQAHGAGRTVALFADDDLGDAVDFRTTLGLLRRTSPRGR